MLVDVADRNVEGTQGLAATSSRGSACDVVTAPESSAAMIAEAAEPNPAVTHRPTTSPTTLVLPKIPDFIMSLSLAVALPISNVDFQNHSRYDGPSITPLRRLTNLFFAPEEPQARAFDDQTPWLAATLRTTLESSVSSGRPRPLSTSVARVLPPTCRAP